MKPLDEGARMKIRLKHLVEDVDRHGNIRLYVRIAGRPKVRIREIYPSDEFMAAYHAAIADANNRQRQAKSAQRGSFRHLCQLYYAGNAFMSLDTSTQSWIRHHLDGICEKHADKPVTMMSSRHVRNLRNELEATPAAANKRLKALKVLFGWATEEEEAKHNPTIGVKKIKYATNGHHTWTAAEIEQYKQRHSLGTKQRLALDLLRFTTGRREDAVRLGPQHTRGGRVKFTQAKNEHRKPVQIDIPLHADLKESIEATQSGHLTFLVTEYGKPYTPAGFGNAMRDWCDQANLRHCSAHGLRKSTATQMAERGATGHEIRAVTGHQSLRQVDVYTQAARNKELADAAFAKWRSK
jgi:site-specific recombinase XerD